MSMLEIHAESRESWIVIYHDFLYEYKENDPIVYGFVGEKKILHFIAES
jgi:hypothetical protein